MYTIISIYTGSTERGIDTFKKSFEALASKKDAFYARVRYSTSKSTNYEAHPLTYPLCVYTNDMVFCIADVTAGYPGTGPHGMVELLKYLGFTFDEEKILSHQDVVQLDITKGNMLLRDSFKEYTLDERDYIKSPFHTY